jgi:hypothetical protein
MTHEDIEFYRKPYTQSREWKKYAKKHPEIKDLLPEEEKARLDNLGV